jgi:hypothetical protein
VTAGSTVTVVEPLTAPSVAVAVVTPGASAWATPSSSIVAADGADDVQVTDGLNATVALFE